MRRKQERAVFVDDADAAAGLSNLPSPPDSRGGLSMVTSASDIEFFEDLVSEPVLVLGMDISHLERNSQFLACACGVFFFSLLYGFLQELLSVQLCSRQLGLFLASVQFIGYTILAFLLRTYVYRTQKGKKLTPKASNISVSSSMSKIPVPFKLYLGLSLLRALDLGMTNLAMQYINYPAKTLMKSSRVVFTMIFGVFITKKTYKCMDYIVVMCMVVGLAIFMHADANSSAVFQPLGVIMLTVSLLCDGAITNMSESIMNKFGVGQDEFIFRMYSIALIAISAAAGAKGDLREGFIWMSLPGTYAEQQANVPLDERAWTVVGKMAVMFLFSSMGFFGSSCSAAITKNFGALTMSITSTARKATTLFLSFLFFDNECTFEHLVGIGVFISALTTKSLRRKNKRRSSKRKKKPALRRMRSSDLETGKLPTSPLSQGSNVLDINRTLSHDSSHASRKSTHRATAVSPGPGSKSPKVRYHVV